MAPTKGPASVLDVFDDELGEAGAAAGVDLADPSGAGDVDLGEMVADYVDAGQDDAQPVKFWSQDVADLLVPCADAVGEHRGPGRHVAAELAGHGYPADHAHGFAIEDDDAPVTVNSGGHPALEDYLAAAPGP